MERENYPCPYGDKVKWKKKKVVIFLWGIPHYLILVENKEIANSYKNQFKILWEKAHE